MSGVLPWKDFDHMKTKNIILSSILNVLFPVILPQYETCLRVGNIDLMRDIVKGVELKNLFYVEKKI